MAARESEAVNPPTDFEVGVFCGTYITPVDQDYFDHLERIRGQTKVLKVEAEARRAVAFGIAAPHQLKVAANGATVNGDGKVVPAEPEDNHVKMPSINGLTKGSDHEGQSVKTRMDISIHNMGDFPGDH